MTGKSQPRANADRGAVWFVWCLTETPPPCDKLLLNPQNEGIPLKSNTLMWQTQGDWRQEGFKLGCKSVILVLFLQDIQQLKSGMWLKDVKHRLTVLWQQSVPLGAFHSALWFTFVVVEWTGTYFKRWKQSVWGFTSTTGWKQHQSCEGSTDSIRSNMFPGLTENKRTPEFAQNVARLMFDVSFCWMRRSKQRKWKACVHLLILWAHVKLAAKQFRSGTRSSLFPPTGPIRSRARLSVTRFQPMFHTFGPVSRVLVFCQTCFSSVKMMNVQESMVSVCMRGLEASGSVPFCVISNCFQPFSLCSFLRIPFLFKTCRLFQIVCLYMACVCSCVYINDNSVEQRDGTSPPVVSGRSIAETCDAEHVCGSCVDVPVGWTHDSSWRMSQHLMLVASITHLLSSLRPPRLVSLSGFVSRSVFTLWLFSSVCHYQWLTVCFLRRC